MKWSLNVINIEGITMKVHIFYKGILKVFGAWVSWISIIVSLIVIVFPIPETWGKKIVVTVFLAVIILIYLFVWLWANLKKNISLKINNTKIVVKEGNIFQETGKKVIPANEYFDTHVGDGIIEPTSLHGQYITTYAQLSHRKLQTTINESLKQRNPILIDMVRKNGNQIKYPLGTIYDDHNGFLLLAYARFDESNRAFMNTEDVLACYNKMWDEIDKCRGNNSISIPVMGGSGIVRGPLANYTEQQLIELLLWSFRISGIHLSRNASLNIIVHKSMIKTINMLDLKRFSD